jgi:ATP-binding cassette subfamily G (WHITE) protein 2 (PDR)
VRNPSRTIDYRRMFALYILSFLKFAGTLTKMIMAVMELFKATINIMFMLPLPSVIFHGYMQINEFGFEARCLITTQCPRTLRLASKTLNLHGTFRTLIFGVLSVGPGNSHISRSPEGYLHSAPLQWTNCSTYIASYMRQSFGSLTLGSMGLNSQCMFCSGLDTNVFPKAVSADYTDRWGNHGI